MELQLRRYDIDWLRVFAIGLLIFYHTGIGFQPWGVFIGFIQNKNSMEGLWVPMSLLNIWRIPLLFFVSGMGVCFSLRRRSVRQLLGERSRRILLPFIFGIVALVPIHLLLWQKYYNQETEYSIHQSHLWFLLNIFTYVVLLTPLFILVKKNRKSKITSVLKRIYSSPLAIIAVMLVFIAEVLLVNPESYEAYANTWHGYFVGFIAFIFGFTFVATGKSFWLTSERWKWVYLIMAISLFIARYTIFDLQSPLCLKATEMVTWIFTAFGFSYKYLNHASPVLAYLSKAAYPVYILHMIFLYLASYIIMPTDIPVTIKFIFVVVFTFAACFVCYEIIIRRIGIIRPLFGLRLNK